MATDTELTPTEYINHHLTFLTKPGNDAGFWSINVDTVVTAVILGIVGIGFIWWVVRGATSGVPGKRQAFVEIAVDFVDEQVKGIFHGDRSFVAPLALTTFVWVVLMNAMDFIPADIFSEGSIGLVSRSGTLTYQIGHELTQLGLGNSTIVGIGGDPVVGSSFIDVLEKFDRDPETAFVVLVGEIGGDEEEKAAAWVAEHTQKPVFSYIAGFSAPPGKTMGHAGAIISGSSGTAQAKKEALEAAGIAVGTTPTEVAGLVAERARQ